MTKQILKSRSLMRAFRHNTWNFSFSKLASNDSFSLFKWSCFSFSRKQCSCLPNRNTFIKTRLQIRRRQFLALGFYKIFQQNLQCVILTHGACAIYDCSDGSHGLCISLKTWMGTLQTWHCVNPLTPRSNYHVTSSYNTSTLSNK